MDDYGRVWLQVKAKPHVDVLLPDSEQDLAYFRKRIQLRKRRDKHIKLDMDTCYKLHFENLGRREQDKPHVVLRITLQRTPALHAGTII